MASTSLSASSLASAFVEVPAVPAAQCWKCHGSGTKVIKMTGVTSSSSSSQATSSPSIAPALSSVECPVCHGAGELSRKRKRPDPILEKPVKIFPGWNPVGPLPPSLSGFFTTTTSTRHDNDTHDDYGNNDDVTATVTPFISISRAIFPSGATELVYLVGNWRIFQAETHKYSTDDVVTAWTAWRIKYFFKLANRTKRTSIQPQSSSSSSSSATAAASMNIVDIGCGLGSVLQMNAWLHPTARCVGIEAQPSRGELARASVLFNGIQDRVSVHIGDLRDTEQIALLLSSSSSSSSSSSKAEANEGAGNGQSIFTSSIPSPSLAKIHLVTGTPPYFDVSQGGLPQNEEAARCLFEYRGGIEAYCKAAADLLSRGRRAVVVRADDPTSSTSTSSSASSITSTSTTTTTTTTSTTKNDNKKNDDDELDDLDDEGLFVVCGAGIGMVRGYKGAKEAGLTVLARVDCIPKVGKPPLFCVFVMCRSGAEHLFGWQRNGSTKQEEISLTTPTPCITASGSSSSSSTETTKHASTTAIPPLLAAGKNPFDHYRFDIVNNLPYADMRTEEYKNSLLTLLRSNAEKGMISDGKKEETPVSSSSSATSSSSSVSIQEQQQGKRIHNNYTEDTKQRQQQQYQKQKQKQQQPQVARGAHVDFQGLPFTDPREIVHIVTVRSTEGLRTPEYIRLLWEMGKPG